MTYVPARASEGPSEFGALEPAASDRDALYEAHWDRVVRVCIHYLGNRADAEDAAQESFLRSWHQAGSASDPGAYLGTVARRVCLNHLRRIGREMSLDSREDLSASEDAEGAAIGRVLAAAALKQLSGRERRLVMMSFAGYSVAEIGEHVGLSRHAATKALVRARLRARQAFGALTALVGVSSAVRRLQNRPLRRTEGPHLSSSAYLAAVITICVTVPLSGSSAAPPRLPSGSAPGALAVAAGTATPAALKWSARNAGLGDIMAANVGSSLARPAHSSSTSPGPPVPSIPAAVTPRQQDYTFNYITSSPSYSSDHTVFASNVCMAACPGSLFRSRDGGSTWSWLPAAGFVGGRILLPPAYPADPVIYASTPIGLQRSDDGGVTFILVVPAQWGGLTASVAAIAPLSHPGAAEIVLGGDRPLVYHADTGGLGLLPGFPLGRRAEALTFAGTGKDLVITGGGVQSGTWDCVFMVSCDEVVSPVNGGMMSLSGNAGAALLQWTHSQVAVFDGVRRAYRTIDIAPTFGSGAGIAGFAGAVTGEDGAPRIWINTASPGPGDSQVWHFWLSGSAQDPAFREVGAGVLGTPYSAVDSLTFLPDGHILTAVTGYGQKNHHFGFRCSPDGGFTWAEHC
jgi:RNA polymerase sigma-70 factor (ECF subfamily)